MVVGSLSVKYNLCFTWDLSDRVFEIMEFKLFQKYCIWDLNQGAWFAAMYVSAVIAVQNLCLM